MYEIYDRLFVCTQSTPISVRLPDPAVPLPPPFNVQEHEVRKQFNQQSSRKAPGPDNVSTSTLKHCDDKLAPVFVDMFSASLHRGKSAERLLPRGFDVSGGEGVGATDSPYAREVCHQLQCGSTPVRLQGQPIHWWCWCLGPALCDVALGVSEQICTHSVRRLPFRVQHGHPTETLWQAASAITRLTDVLLNSWLSSAATPGCQHKRYCVQHYVPEHWNSPGMCPFPASPLHVHKWICIQLRTSCKDDTTLEGLWPVAWHHLSYVNYDT